MEKQDLVQKSKSKPGAVRNAAAIVMMRSKPKGGKKALLEAALNTRNNGNTCTPVYALDAYDCSALFPILKPLSIFLLFILLGCASYKKSITEENLVDMKELSGLKVGMDKDEAMGALSTEPIDSLTPEVNGIKYQSYYYLCKTGVRTHHSAGAYSPGQDSYPVVHYWMTFQDSKLICKGPIQKYLIHDTEAIRKIGAAIEAEKGKMDGRAIYLR